MEALSVPRARRRLRISARPNAAQLPRREGAGGGRRKAPPLVFLRVPRQGDQLRPRPARRHLPRIRGGDRQGDHEQGRYDGRRHRARPQEGRRGVRGREAGRGNAPHHHLRPQARWPRKGARLRGGELQGRARQGGRHGELDLVRARREVRGVHERSDLQAGARKGAQPHRPLRRRRADDPAPRLRPHRGRIARHEGSGSRDRHHQEGRPARVQDRRRRDPGGEAPRDGLRRAQGRKPAGRLLLKDGREDKRLAAREAPRG